MVVILLLLLPLDNNKSSPDETQFHIICPQAVLYSMDVLIKFLQAITLLNLR